MASLLQLQAEAVWSREITPAPLNKVFHDLCSFYGTNPIGGGTKGNEFHLYGRHRSIEWAETSRYCTDRSYGTRDARDRSGNHQHIRAFDTPLQPANMIKVSHFLDEAVRSGKAPMIAEWFGTFDGRNVTGWFEGHVSSSDNSHLTHAHVGLWTKYADDDMTKLFDIMTGADMALTAADAEVLSKADVIRNGYPDLGTNPNIAFDTFAFNVARDTTLMKTTLATLAANVALLAGKDFVDEQAVVDGVLAGLGGVDPVEAATALKAVLTPAQIAALVAALTA